MSKSSVLTKSDLVLVFALAKAGLGHFRVTDALYRGLPSGAALLLGTQDDTIEWLHRFVTVHPITRAIGEWIQRGWPQDIFTYFYRDSLRHHTETLYNQMLTILDQRVEQPKRMLVVATHFALAHQMAAIKRKLMLKRGIEVILVVVVTDDSPQHLWAVSGADMTVVPSARTRNALRQYHESQRMAPTTWVVAPYPVSLKLGEHLHASRWEARQEQANPVSHTQIQVVIPIAGAAVQLDYFEKLVSLLSAEERLHFWIVSKQGPPTRMFLEKMLGRIRVSLVTSPHDRDVVRLYEQLYAKEVIMLEVTKPSEQAFKALIEPKRVGGSILLFSDPVGRQEHDNIQFLRRHNLIPDKDVQVSLWHLAFSGKHLAEATRQIAEELSGWRGLRLPEGAEESATFIRWCLREGIFAKMLEFRGYQNHSELSADGVKVFWEKVAEYLSQRI